MLRKSWRLQILLATLFTENVGVRAALHRQDSFLLVFWKSITFCACFYVSRQQAGERIQQCKGNPMVAALCTQSQIAAGS